MAVSINLEGVVVIVVAFVRAKFLTLFLFLGQAVFIDLKIRKDCTTLGQSGVVLLLRGYLVAAAELVVEWGVRESTLARCPYNNWLVNFWRL